MVCSMLVVGALVSRRWAPREGTPGGSAHGASQLLLQGCLRFRGTLGMWCLAYIDKLPIKHHGHGPAWGSGLVLKEALGQFLGGKGGGRGTETKENQSVDRCM